MDSQSTLSEVAEFICDNLPEDWAIVIQGESGALTIELLDPESAIVDFDDIERQVWQMIAERVNYARAQDGLAPTDDCCEHGVIDGDWCEKCSAERKRAEIEANSP
jgi:hypothetical protein